MQEFLKKVAEVLEVESVDSDTRFRDVPDWDSVKGLGLIVMINDDYHVEVSVEEFMASQIVGDLAALAKI